MLQRLYCCVMEFVKNESNTEDKDKDKKIVGFIPEILSLCTEHEGRG